MYCRFIIFVFILLSLSLIDNQGAALAQNQFDQLPEYVSPYFHFDLVNVISPKPEMSRLNIFIKLPYDELQFILDENVYHARFEFAAVIYDRKDNLIESKSLQEKIELENFDLTNSRREFHTSYINFDLPPGKYKVSLTMYDENSEKSSMIENQIKLKSFREKDIMVSDISFVRNLVIDSLGIKSFSPDIANNILDINHKLFAYFEIYSKIDYLQKYTISYAIKNFKRKTIFEDSYDRRKDAFRTLEAFYLPIHQLTMGNFLLEITVRSSTYRYKTSRFFNIRWVDFPNTIANLDLAIKQLKFIATPQTYKYISEAPKHEKLARFIQFWKTIDPTPGTQVNELMDEYYRRIRFANSKFNGQNEGWLTDMGMVYIVLGPPSQIERHPFDVGSKPYEIWYYEIKRKEFVFVDQNAIGQYRLLPEYWYEFHSAY